MGSFAHSWSQIENFRQCPKKGEFGYRSSTGTAAAPRGDIPPGAFVGKLSHEGIAQILKDEGFPCGKEMVDDWINSNGLDSVCSMDLVPDEERASVKNLVERVLRRWSLICQRNFESHVPIEIESSFELDFRGILFTGRVDAVSEDPEGNIWVIDWKSGRIRRRHWTQVGSYALWAREKYSSNVGDIIATIVNLGTGNRKTRTIDSEVDARLRTRIQGECERIEDRLERNDTPAKPGSACQTCAFLDRCQEGRKYIQGNPTP